MHLGLDRHGIEPLAAGERTLSPRGLLAIWLAPGLGLVPFGVGLIAAAQMIGLGWWDGLAAIALGSVAAAGLVASVAAAGAPAGVPQMAVGRASFGRAIVLPALVDWAGLVTWSGIFTVFGAQALADLTGEGIDLGVWLVVMALGQAALAIVGLPLIRRFDAYAAVALAVAFAAITAVLAGHLDLSLGDGPNSDPATFVLMVAVAFGLNLGWAVTAADYARYVTPGTTRRAIFGVTFAGLAVPAIWLEGLGLAVARAAPAAADPVQAFQELVGGGPWGAVAMGAVVVATLAANGMLLYSASLSLLATGIRVSRPAIASLSSGMALAVAALVMALAVQGWVENVTLLVSYWIPPFVAIVLLDTARRTDAPAGQAPPGLRRLPWGVNALAAWLLGIAAAVPFMAQTFFVGPLAGALGGADLGYPIGFVVGAAAYAVLRRLPSRRRRGAVAVPVADGSVPTLGEPTA